MYRSLGKLTSFGVPSGPYSGKPRRIVWNRLPREVKERLVASLEGRGRPAPIAIDVPARTRTSVLARRLVLGALLGTVALTGLVVHSWPRAQASWFSALYMLAVLPLALLGGLLLHRRIVRGGAPLDPGKVLFPLDLLTFDGQTLTLVPLGSVCDVGVTGVDERATTAETGTPAIGIFLVLRFESGEEAKFPMPSAIHADRTYAALGEAHKTLEALSYGEDLEKALDYDPFFSVRTGAGLDEAEASPHSRAASRIRAWPLRAALVPAVLVAALAGHVAFVSTGRFSDQMRFEKAFAENTENAMRDYLSRGGLRVREAEYFLGARRVQKRKDFELDQMRDRVARNEALLAATTAPSAKNPAGFVLPKTAAEWNKAHSECLRAFTDRAPSPSKVMPSLFALAEEARRGTGGPARLDIRFERTIAKDVSLPSLDAQLEARERETARALALVLAEACPPSVLEVKLARGVRVEKSPALVVRYEVRKPAPRERSGAKVMLAEVRFDATVEVWPKKPVGFGLTLPPPDEARETTRERSLFRIDETAPLVTRVYGAFTARAFDRLYDELYGLFFSGEVKVPLPGFAEVERIFMK